MPEVEMRADPELLLLSIGRGRWTTLAHVISAWDMLDAGIPCRTQLERSAAILLGSGLIDDDDRGRLRPTRAAMKLLASPSLKHLRPRLQVRELRVVLQGHLRPPADYALQEQVYRAAVDEYVSRGVRRVERLTMRSDRWVASPRRTGSGKNRGRA
ncbi:hypothetical protein KNO15_00160 [Leifsonia shinshuensis]|uniref:hypothetical protein n=1 Tax=Leifsonia shinshuensis TaxID=150026 RepID=UPI001F5092FD|nr:hypothetical protein [Leifsonia shinshuensis]MCI0155115.1 hypothetical protein [Leifsonia shinshuensis]